MAKHRRKIWEDLLDMRRRIKKELDDLFEPKTRPSRNPARVPVPIPKRRSD